MILLVDNYDSFTFNLYQYLHEVNELTEEIRVVRNDQVSIAEVHEMRPSAIVLSPGPCTPNEAGISIELVQQLSGDYPILGVCLGHQAIGQAFGARIVRASTPMHGKVSAINHQGSGIFRGIPSPCLATRYHSLVIDPNSLPACLEVSASSFDRHGAEEIMAICHREHPQTIGLQFHPESIMTNFGKRLLANFLQACRP